MLIMQSVRSHYFIKGRSSGKTIEHHQPISLTSDPVRSCFPSMDSLPVEILVMIASYCTGYRFRFSSLATISPKWQYAAESRTLAEVKLRFQTDPPRDDVAMFRRVFRSPTRRSLLREIVLEIGSAVSLSSTSTGYTEFGQGVREVLSYIRSWGEEEERRNIKLSAVCYFSDSHNRNGHPHRYTNDETRSWSLLRCDNSAVVLPTVLSIISFSECTPDGLCPRTLGPILRALPTLKNITLRYPRGMHQSGGGDLRDKLARSLSDLSFAHLGSFSFYANEQGQGNRYGEPQGSVPADVTRDDELSKGLRRISQLPSMRQFELLGNHMLTADLFQVGDNEKWPCLKVMEIEAFERAPNQAPYFPTTLRERGWANFNHLLYALTHAVSAMPMLQRLTFSMRLGGRRCYAEYLASGVAGTMCNAADIPKYNAIHKHEMPWGVNKIMKRFDEQNRMVRRWEVCFFNNEWVAPENIRSQWKATVGKNVHLITGINL